MNLRLVTINFWGTEPPLERRLALAIRQLRALAPDVVAMQEVRPLDGGGGGDGGDGSGKTTAHAIADALGMTACYERSTVWADGAWPGATAGEEGLAILARHPIAEYRSLELPEPRPVERRILLSARVATPVGSIWVHTTHLHYRLDDGVARERQVVAIDEAIRALGRTPADAPQVLCGDFNATPDSDEMRYLRGLTTLAARRTHFQDAWLRHHPEPGITWSSENELTRPLRSLDIDRRIDYVYVTSRKKDGRGTIHRAEVVLTERDDGICASDHYGVLAEIQIAPT